MVSHIFWATCLGCLVTGAQNYITQETPSCAPRCTARNILLYNYGMVELATRETELLVHSRNHNRENYWLQAESRRHEVGTKAVLRTNLFYCFMHFSWAGRKFNERWNFPCANSRMGKEHRKQFQIGHATRMIESRNVTFSFLYLALRGLSYKIDSVIKDI